MSKKSKNLWWNPILASLTLILTGSFPVEKKSISKIGLRHAIGCLFIFPMQKRPYRYISCRSGRFHFSITGVRKKNRPFLTVYFTREKKKQKNFSCVNFRLIFWIIFLFWLKVSTSGQKKTQSVVHVTEQYSMSIRQKSWRQNFDFVHNYFFNCRPKKLISCLV